MAWIRLDDQIAHHPKFIRAGLSSWLWVGCVGFAQKFLTDGHVPCGAIATLCGGVDRPQNHINKLVRCGLLERVKDGYQVHDYLDFNDSAETVRRKRLEDRVRKGFRKESAQNPIGIRETSSRARPRPIPSHPIQREEVVERRGKQRPIFQGQRFVVFQWQDDNLAAVLGSEVEGFQVGDWYRALDTAIASNGATDTDWPWLRKQLIREIRKRGLSLDSENVIREREKDRPRTFQHVAFECPHDLPCPNRNACKIASELRRPLKGSSPL